jgi:N-acetylglucosamine kinase-like BadF-type ATPase
VGVDVHYRRLPQQRLGELAPLVVAAAAGGDAVARELILRLAGEIGLWVERALRDLAVDEADVVLGGGMLRHGEGLFHRLVLEQLPGGANPVVANVPPVLGAALAALDAAGAAWKAKDRLRSELDGS